ncbi:MAG: hypothetical protein ABI972_26715 [Acidobacteriota bacterium]
MDRRLGEYEADMVDALLIKPAAPTTLERSLAAALSRASQRGGDERTTNVRTAPGKVRVLVAEDNLVNQTGVKRLLGRLGYIVEVVPGSGGRAVV